MSPLTLVALFLGLVASQNVAPLCYPPACTIDDNCNDAIHSRFGGINAKCCGGKCQPTPQPANLLVNQQCTPSNAVDSKEVCFGSCVGYSVCGTKPGATCEAQMGPGCACTVGSECLSNNCAFSNAADNHTTCRAVGGSQDHGEVCAIDVECRSGVCSNLVCVGLIAGQNCTADQQCVPGLICLKGGCAAPCAVGSAGCCQFDADCSGGGVSCPCGTSCKIGKGFGICQSDGHTCSIFFSGCAGRAVLNNRDLGLANRTTYCDQNTFTCTALPGAGQPCTNNECLDGYECATTCTTTAGPCTVNSTCQAFRSLAPGALCSLNSQQLCSTFCSRTDVSYGAEIGTCSAPASVLDGGKCGDTSECMPPANICSDTSSPATGQATCKVNGSAPLGGRCTRNGVPNECPSNLQCVQGVPNSVCAALLPLNATCQQGGPKCDVGLFCYDFSTNYEGNCGSPVSNCNCGPYVPLGTTCITGAVCGPNAICTQKSLALGPRCYPRGTQEDGQQCNTTVECKSPDSRCVIPPAGNYSCRPILGSECTNPGECDVSPPTPGKWDCSCSRKCYILNTPTPAPTFVPTVTVNPCQSQLDAWTAVTPYRFPARNPYVLANDLQTGSSFLVSSLALDNATLSKWLDYVCCTTCNQYKSLLPPFQSPIYHGYQIDCSAKTLTLLTQDKCNKKLAQPGMLACWPGVVAAASVSTLSSLSVLAVFMMVLY